MFDGEAQYGAMVMLPGYDTHVAGTGRWFHKLAERYWQNTVFGRRAKSPTPDAKTKWHCPWNTFVSSLTILSKICDHILLQVELEKTITPSKFKPVAI